MCPEMMDIEEMGAISDSRKPSKKALNLLINLLLLVSFF